MKKITCPCGAEFKAHTVEEIVEIANVHAKHAHSKDYPNGIPRDMITKNIKDA